MLRALALSAVWCLVTGTVGRAQAASPLLGPGVAEALARLQPETPVRIRLRDGSLARGRFVTVRDGALRLIEASGPEAVNLSDATALWVRARHTKAGAIVGGLGGMGLGVFFGMIVNALCETDDCRGTGVYALAIPLTTASGAALGGVVGSAIPRWKRVAP